MTPIERLKDDVKFLTDPATIQISGYETTIAEVGPLVLALVDAVEEWATDDDDCSGWENVEKVENLEAALAKLKGES